MVWGEILLSQAPQVEITVVPKQMFLAVMWSPGICSFGMAAILKREDVTGLLYRGKGLYSSRGLSQYLGLSGWF